ncbi:recombinase family protein [Pseudactinotalea sp.]|uniref:recombinase family protein n=1 Tax=Pseudactinotalea sp. TaxID=1926260 RepID=UPI003B3AED82
MNVAGYLRVSTADQEYGIDAQRAAIETEASRRGWQVTFYDDAGRSGRDTTRPGLQEALRALQAGEEQVLVVSKLDRLSRSVADFATLMDKARQQSWAVVALDLGIETTPRSGDLVANIMISIAQWERRIIGQRTREGLAAAKAKGVRLGSPVLLPAEVEARIVAEREQGASLRAIADGLNAEAVPLPGRGKRWLPGSVKAVLDRVA